MTTNKNTKQNLTQIHLEFIKRMRTIRRALHLRQNDVAAIACISREAYLRAESGQADPRLSTVLAAAQAMGYELQLVRTDAVDDIARKAHTAKTLRETRTDTRSTSMSPAFAKPYGPVTGRISANSPSEFNGESTQQEKDRDSRHQGMDSGTAPNLDDAAVPQVSQ